MNDDWMDWKHPLLHWQFWVLPVGVALLVAAILLVVQWLS
jgi:hypothetical protein